MVLGNKVCGQKRKSGSTSFDFHSSKPFEMKEAKLFKRCLLSFGIIGSSLIWCMKKSKSAM